MVSIMALICPRIDSYLASLMGKVDYITSSSNYPVEGITTIYYKNIETVQYTYILK